MNVVEKQKLSLPKSFFNESFWPLIHFSQPPVYSDHCYRKHTTLLLRGTSLLFSDNVDSRKCRDRLVEVFWSKNDSDFLNVDFKVLTKNGHGIFRLVQTIKTREASFNQIMRLKNLLHVAVKNFTRQKNLFTKLIPTLCLDVADKPKLADKVALVQFNGKVCVTLLCYKMKKRNRP